MLVGDLADDLLDHVLQRHDPRGPAVLVHHDRELEAGAPQEQQEGIEADGLGHVQGVHHEGGHGDVLAAFVRHGQGLLDVDDTVDVVEVVPDHGEP